MADDQTEGVSLAVAAAACGVDRRRGRVTSPSAGVRGDAAVRRDGDRGPCARCGVRGPGRPLSGAPGGGAWATSPWPRCTTRRRCGWPAGWSSPPFVAAAEVELARTLRRRHRKGDEGRVAVLLRSAEESALRHGLHRLAQLAAEPG